MKGLSLFSGAGIAEMGLKNTDISIIVANELLKYRALAHEFWHPGTKMICGDIKDPIVREELISESINNEVEFILATPPCQGMSLIGKNKSNSDMLNDDRNYLIFDVVDFIKILSPKYVLIENVPRFFKIKYMVQDKESSIIDIINDQFQDEYNIKFNVYNSADYGVPQNRNRAFIRIWKKGLIWEDPIEKTQITVREAIGGLPSLESGQNSNIKNHVARKHTSSHVSCMKYTPTGKSAFENEVHYPKKPNGDKLKGFSATYKRIDWDKPAPTITMRNDAISSQSNVHPGRLLHDGTYSDARVLTLREIFILMSMNPDLDIPPGISDIQVRHIVGEAVPPLLIESIVKGIKSYE